MSRVGIVTTSYPRHDGDAAGNFVEGHARALVALGHRVHVIAAGPPSITEDGALVVERIGDSPLFYRGGAPDRIEHALARSLVDGAAFTARLAATVAQRAHAWDSIVAHWLVPSALAALPAGKPLLAIAHGGDVHTLRRLHLLGATLRLLRARDARLVFVSSQLRELARRAVPDLVAGVQPMGIDVDRFAAIARGDRAPSTETPIVFVAARLVPIKGVDIAIAAFARLRTPARLVIAGDGPERAALAQRARGLAVELLGQISTSERDRWLGQARLVVVPSRIVASGRTEGAPTIALEALAAGVPVVASAVGGLIDLPVARVAPDDPIALAAAIDRSLAGPAEVDRALVESLDWRHVAPRLVRSEGFASR